MSQRCAQEVVDSGREAFGQRGLREQAGAFRVGRGLREFLCCSTGASTERTRVSNQPEDTGRLLASPAPACLSFTPPSEVLRFLQSAVRRRQEGRKTKQEPPMLYLWGPPKLLN